MRLEGHYGGVSGRSQWHEPAHPVPAPGPSGGLRPAIPRRSLTCCHGHAPSSRRSAHGTASDVRSADGDASARGDRRGSDAPAVVPAQAPRLDRILAAAAGQGVALAVVDTAPRAEQGAVAAARAADLVLMPSRPAVYDVETVAGTRDLVPLVAPWTPVLCVLNAVPPRGPREGQARALLADFGVSVAAPRLGQRAAVDFAAVAGQSAAEHEPRGRAAAEIAALWAAVGELTCLTPAAPGPAMVRSTDLRRAILDQASRGDAGPAPQPEPPSPRPGRRGRLRHHPPGAPRRSGQRPVRQARPARARRARLTRRPGRGPALIVAGGVHEVGGLSAAGPGCQAAESSTERLTLAEPRWSSGLRVVV